MFLLQDKPTFTFCHDEILHLFPETVALSQADSVACLCLSNYDHTSRTVSQSLPLPVSEIQGCGFSSKEETGVIKSQNWPMNYKANAECMWNIAGPLGKKITLTFTHFDLEAKDLLTFKCYDNIMVYDINNLTNVLIKKHGKLVCGIKRVATN